MEIPRQIHYSVDVHSRAARNSSYSSLPRNSAIGRPARNPSPPRVYLGSVRINWEEGKLDGTR